MTRYGDTIDVLRREALFTTAKDQKSHLRNLHESRPDCLSESNFCIRNNQHMFQNTYSHKQHTFSHHVQRYAPAGRKTMQVLCQSEQTEEEKSQKMQRRIILDDFFGISISFCRIPPTSPTHRMTSRMIFRYSRSLNPHKYRIPCRRHVSSRNSAVSNRRL